MKHQLILGPVLAVLVTVLGCQSPTSETASGTTPAPSALPMASPVPAGSYTVTYFGNGAQGAVPVDGDFYKPGAQVTVLGPGKLAESGVIFEGWNTLANGSGTFYPAGDLFSMGSTNLALFAQWVPAADTIVYNPNGGTGTMANQGLPAYDSSFLTPNAFTKPGFLFIGWNTVPGGTGISYANGAGFTMGPTGVVLYAQWGPSYTVTYNADIGSGPPPATMAYLSGATVTVAGAGGLAYPGYSFAGWTTNPAVTGPSVSYAPGATLVLGTSNITLYAVWVPAGLAVTSSGNSIAITGWTAGNPYLALTIPPGVTALGDFCLEDCTLLSGVIPSSVTSIGYQVLLNGGASTPVWIPSSVTSLDPAAFQGCHAPLYGADQASPVVQAQNGILYDRAGTTVLAAGTNLTGTVQVLAGVAIIGDYSFDGCSQMTGVTLPASLTSIGCQAFASTGLTSVTIPPNVGFIDQWAFESTNLTTVVIPAGVKTVNDEAFEYCPNLTSLSLSSTVTYYGPSDSCPNLETLSVDPANTCYESVGGVVFDKAGDTLVQFPGGVTGNYQVPAGVVTIGHNAFSGCSLTSVTLPAGVTNLEDSSFTGGDLTGVTFLSPVPPSLQEPNDTFDGPGWGFVIHVPSASAVAAYLAAGWGAYADQIVTP